MKSIYHSRAVAAPPDMPVSETSEGYPTNGSPTGGTLSTVIGAYWYHMITAEIVNAIQGGGLSPDAEDLTQLNASIDARIKKFSDAAQAAIDAVSGRVSSLKLIPTGAVMAFAGDRAPNADWLVCDGRAVSRDGYADLFRYLGTKYGGGNGRTTFNLPDYRDRFLQGSNWGIGQRIEAGLPNITGNFRAAVDAHGERHANGVFALGDNYNPHLRHMNPGENWGSWFDFNAARSNGIYGRSGTVQPPAVRTLYCIHI